MPPRGPDRLVTGLFVGAALAFIIAALIDNQVGATLKEQWPTFFISTATVFAAIYGAFIALKGPQAQIAQQHEIEKQRSNARRTASRALLPIIASEVHLICAAAIELSFTKDGFFREMSNMEGAMAPLELSHATTERISRCLETAQPNESAILQIVLAHYQVCYARTRNRFAENYVNPHRQVSVSQAVDWATLRGFSDHLYVLGRLNSEDLDDYIDASKLRFKDTPNKTAVDWDLIQDIESKLDYWVISVKGTRVIELKEKLFSRP